MTETWTSLLAAFVGAIVGGAASLAGTVLVNKMQMSTNARMRLYDELLPKLEQAADRMQYPPTPTPFEQEERLAAVLAMRRAGAVAGRHERKAVNRLVLLFQGPEWVNPGHESFPGKHEAITEDRPFRRHMDGDSQAIGCAVSACRPKVRASVGPRYGRSRIISEQSSVDPLAILLCVHR